ncbi:uncharacterized protein THITE_2110626 [Thermothielavioides terrestris NRRL 8126]|uniref:Uncharacterized protein n=1 Tax=Thermothielavioides terrestris (strain ATCC 38088 / NRRL 8126) TaxID=578455 RepID=G2QTP6_THETT|nr:uncharacterized protein THITE_2110626 [Thermothielavioides terrestris NRRL 8126]AEO64465.1 hypothetical protein THITE_2110626 [Thermothielavioides terrestris NRRL 8126]
MNCKECIEYTQRVCRRCGGGYCIIHNEGSNMFAGVWAKTGRSATETSIEPTETNTPR